MKKLIHSTLLLSLAVFAFAQPALAQDNEPAPPATVNTESRTAGEAEAASSQEVEINEDTYRQFMELKDANRQGDIIPETAFKPGSGLQKLEKLPEESQKHLRDELREIIVQGDPWQPGDEAAEYPYTPSAAASKDPALQTQEMEAWGELVDSYNQREAQIYANKAGNRATMNPDAGNDGNPGDSANSKGEDGEDKEGLRGQPATQADNPDRDETAGGFSPNAVSDPNAKNASGVSQNALEFLQGLGNGGENTAGEDAGAPRGTGGQPGSSASTGDQGQAQRQTGQQASTGQADDTPAGIQNTAADAAASKAGASQNALEFLNQATAQSGDTGKSGLGSPSADNGQDSARTEAQPEGQKAGEQGEGQAGLQAEGQTRDGQQAEAPQNTESITLPDNEIPLSTAEPEKESTEGAAQNALEYLSGESAQTGEDTAGEMETGAPPAGTLNIQDLLNAQGLGNSTGTEPATPAAGEQKPSEKANTDRDGDGR